VPGNKSEWSKSHALISKNYIDGQTDSQCGSGDEGGPFFKSPSIVQGIKATIGSETVLESGSSQKHGNVILGILKPDESHLSRQGPSWGTHQSYTGSEKNKPLWSQAASR
jgi:hypothetical protein